MSTPPEHVQQPESFVFTAANLEEALKIIAKYPEGRQASAVMPLLDMAQRQHGGWLPLAAMDYVADMLDMPRMRVYEVATFYTMYNRAPMGEHHVQVCTNLPCWLRGSDDVLATCKRVTGAALGGTSEDGKFSLSEAECLGACVNAPMMQIDDDYYEDLDSASTETILNEIRLGETPRPGSQIGRRSCEPIGGLTSLTGTKGAE